MTKYFKLDPKVACNCANVVANVLTRNKIGINKTVTKDLTKFSEFTKWMQENHIIWIIGTGNMEEDSKKINKSFDKFVYLRQLQNDTYHAVLYSKEPLNDVGVVDEPCAYYLPPTFKEFVNFNFDSDVYFDPRLEDLYPYLNYSQLLTFLKQNAVQKYSPFPEGYKDCYYFFENKDELMSCSGYQSFRGKNGFQLQTLLGVDKQFWMLRSKALSITSLPFYEDKQKFKAFILSKHVELKNVLRKKDLHWIKEFPNIYEFKDEPEIHYYIEKYRGITPAQAKKVIYEVDSFEITQQSRFNKEKQEVKISNVVSNLINQYNSKKIKEDEEDRNIIVNACYNFSPLSAINIIKPNPEKFYSCAINAVQLTDSPVIEFDHDTHCWSGPFYQYVKDNREISMLKMHQIFQFYDSLGINVLLNVEKNKYIGTCGNDVTIFIFKKDNHIQTSDLYELTIPVPAGISFTTKALNAQTLEYFEKFMYVQELQVILNKMQYVVNKNVQETNVNADNMYMLNDPIEKDPREDQIVKRIIFQKLSLLYKTKGGIKRIQNNFLYDFIPNAYFETSHGYDLLRAEDQKWSVEESLTVNSKGKFCSNFKYSYFQENYTVFKNITQLEVHNSESTEEEEESSSNEQFEFPEDLEDGDWIDHIPKDSKNRYIIEEHYPENVKQFLLEMNEAFDELPSIEEITIIDSSAFPERVHLGIARQIIDLSLPEASSKINEPHIRLVDTRERGHAIYLTDENCKGYTVYPRKIEGISNQGNDCFLNAALQALRHMSALVGEQCGYTEKTEEVWKKLIAVGMEKGSQDDAYVALNTLVFNRWNEPDRNPCDLAFVINKSSGIKQIFGKIIHTSTPNEYKQLDGGHYIYLGKYGNDYYEFNDGITTKITEKEFNKYKGTILLAQMEQNCTVSFSDCIASRTVYVSGEEFKLYPDFNGGCINGKMFNVVANDNEYLENLTRVCKCGYSIETARLYLPEGHFENGFFVGKNVKIPYKLEINAKSIKEVISKESDPLYQKLYKYAKQKYGNQFADRLYFNYSIPKLMLYSRSEYLEIMEKCKLNLFNELSVFYKEGMSTKDTLLIFFSEKELNQHITTPIDIKQLIIKMYQQNDLDKALDTNKYNSIATLMVGNSEEFYLNHVNLYQGQASNKYFIPNKYRYTYDKEEKKFKNMNDIDADPQGKFSFIGPDKQLFINQLSDDAMFISTKGYLEARGCYVNNDHTKIVKDDGIHTNINKINLLHKSIIIKRILNYASTHVVHRIIDITGSSSDFDMLGEILNIPVIKCFSGFKDLHDGATPINSIDFTANDVVIFSDCLYYEEIKEKFNTIPSKCYVVGSYYFSDEGRYSEFTISKMGTEIYVDGECSAWTTSRENMEKSRQYVKTFTQFSWPGIIMYCGERDFHFEVPKELYIPNNTVTALFPAGICQEVNAYTASCQARSKMTPTESIFFMRYIDKIDTTTCNDLAFRTNHKLTGVFKLMGKYILDHGFLMKMQQKSMLKNVKTRYELCLDLLRSNIQEYSGLRLTATIALDIISLFDRPTEADIYLAEVARNCKTFRCFSHIPVLLDNQVKYITPDVSFFHYIMRLIESEHLIKSFLGFKFVHGINLIDRLSYVIATMHYYTLELADQYETSRKLEDIFKPDFSLKEGGDWLNLNDYIFKNSKKDLAYAQRYMRHDEHKTDILASTLVDILPIPELAKKGIRLMMTKEGYSDCFKKIPLIINKGVSIAAKVKTLQELNENYEDYIYRRYKKRIKFEKYGIDVAEGEVIKKYIPWTIVDGATYVFPLCGMNEPVENNQLKDWSTWNQWSTMQQMELIKFLKSNFELDEYGYHISAYEYTSPLKLPNYDIIRGHLQLYNKMIADSHLATSSPNDINESFLARFNALVKPDDKMLIEFDTFVDAELKKWEYDIKKEIDEQSLQLADYFRHLSGTKKIEAESTWKQIEKGVEKIVHKFHMIMKDNEMVISEIDKFDRVIMAPDKTKKLLIGFYAFILEQALIKVVPEFAIGVTGKDIEKKFKPFMNTQYKCFSLDGKSFDGHQHVQLLRSVDNRFADMLAFIDAPDWFKKNHTLLKKETHNAFVGNLLCKYFYGNKAMHDIVSFIGKTPSGHAFHTTNMNTIRSVLYQKFIFYKQGIEGQVFAAGDDTVVFVKREEEDIYKQGLEFVYCFDKNKKGGLGQFLKDLVELDEPEFCSMRFTQYGVLKNLRNALFRNITWSEVDAMEICKARAKSIIDWHYSPELEEVFKKYYNVTGIDLDTEVIQDLHYTKVCNGRQDIPIIAFSDVEMLWMLQLLSIDNCVNPVLRTITTRAEMLTQLYSDQMFLFSKYSAEEYQNMFVKMWSKQSRYDEYIIREVLEAKYKINY